MEQDAGSMPSEKIRLTDTRQLKVRQPLAGAKLRRNQPLASGLEALLQEELNLKTVNYDEQQTETISLDTQLTPELLQESYAREAMRQIQDLRKEAKYKLDEKVSVAWETDNVALATALKEFAATIMSDTLLKEFKRGHPTTARFDIEKESTIASGIKWWVGIKK